jgi:hypothetical protein
MTVTQPRTSAVASQAARPEPADADESAVVHLGAGSSGDVGARDLVGTGFSYRHDWGDRNGQLILPLNWGAVSPSSRVLVSIGEGAPGGGKFIGNARYTVHNVAPRAGGVDVWVNIEWSTPIRLYVDYLVVN